MRPWARDGDRVVHLDVERLLRERLDALGPAPRAELLRCLMLPDHNRAGVIGEYFQDPRTRPSPSC